MAGSRARRQDQTKSWAVTGSPLDQRPSGCSLKVMTRRSSLKVQLAAAPGSGSRVQGFLRVSPS